jgi:hypothetical protein
MFLHRFARFRAELRTSRFGLGSAGDAEGTGARHAAALRPRLEKLPSHAQGRSHRRTRDRVGSLCHASSSFSSGDISRPCRTRGRSGFRFAKTHQAVKYRVGNEVSDKRDDFDGKASRLDSRFMERRRCKP